MTHHRRSADPPLDLSGLTDEERVDVSTGTRALAIKVGHAEARKWARARVAELLAARGREASDG